jgi:two-component system, OmpR family, sensor kinase
MKSPLRNSSLRNRLTVGVLLLSALAFAASGFAVQSSLRSYLMDQVDEQLLSVVGGTTLRLDRAGIAGDDEGNQRGEESKNKGNPARMAAPPAPLTRVPTSTSVTLIDPFGNIIGGIGGDLSANQINDYVKGLMPGEIALNGDKPFTIEAPGADFRVVTLVLPSALGSVVVAQSLADFDKTTDRVGLVLFFIYLLVLIVIAAASRQVIRISLKPLEDVEETAELIAAGDLSARLPDAKPDTEVGRLVTSLNQMLTRIEESFAIKEESESKLRRFIADASHELRTPLTAIRGFAELHRQGAVPNGEPTKELLGRIENESVRMGTLVEDLLLLARLDQSREMEMKPVNLSKVVNECVASARAAGPTHPITISAVVDEVFALGDETRIYQVISNLLTNARVHTPIGTPIAVALNQSDDGVAISVTDNGNGLTMDDQAKIFERFFRVDLSRQRNSSEGSGLGLSIVDAVMRAHGGRVSVTSEQGKGATFTLFFPLTQ